MSLLLLDPHLNSLSVLQAAAMVRLAQVSTGTPSVSRSSWITAVRITPMPGHLKA